MWACPSVFEEAKMGAYLSAPITEKVRSLELLRVGSEQERIPRQGQMSTVARMQETDEEENPYFRYGIAAMQGWRVTMVGYPWIRWLHC